MSELTMTPYEREAFLADRHVAVLSVARPDGPPLVTPVWYRYADGLVRFATEQSSQKAALMETTGVASVCVQREENPPAFVTVDGPVHFAPATPDDVMPIVSRYLDDDRARAFVEHAPDDVIVTLTPKRWFTSDFAKLPS